MVTFEISFKTLSVLSKEKFIDLSNICYFKFLHFNIQWNVKHLVLLCFTSKSVKFHDNFGTSWAVPSYWAFSCYKTYHFGLFLLFFHLYYILHTDPLPSFPLVTSSEFFSNPLSSLSQS